MKTLICILVLMLATLSTADVIHVPTDQSTIQAGIDIAVDGDTVLVAEGTYVENINFKGKAITVASHYAVDQDTSHIAKTIIDGSGAANPDSASTVLFVSGEDTTSVLTGFTITGGSGTVLKPEESGVNLYGGGLFCLNSGCKITNNIFTGNEITCSQIAEGGGMYVFSDAAESFAVIRDNVIQQNKVTGDFMAVGGGISIGTPSLIQNNKIRKNKAISNGAMSLGGAIGVGYGAEQNDAVIIRGNDIFANESIALATGSEAWGAIASLAPNVHIVNNRILNNTTQSTRYSFGMGVFLMNAANESRIIGNIITGNKDTGGEGAGGGIFIRESSDVLVEKNVIENNNTDRGVGLLAYEARVIVQDNTVRNNVADVWGGGIANQYSTMLIQNNLVSGNSAVHFGGGLEFIEVTSALVQNNIVFGNSAGASGGGAACAGPPENLALHLPPLPDLDRFKLQRASTSASTIPELNAVVFMNNTITANKAEHPQGGAGIYARDIPVYVVNSIVWGNESPSATNQQIWDKYDNCVYVYNSDVEGGYSGMAFDVIDADPMFLGPRYFLSSDSPCIGAGLTELKIMGQTVVAPPLDYGGRPRPMPAGSAPDLGAWEHRLAQPKPSHTLHVPADFATIQEAINASSDGDTVLVAEGTYYENINFVGKAITVASHFLVDQDTSHISKTVIDGSTATNPDSASTVLFISGEDSTSVLTGFTITGGSGTEWHMQNYKVLCGGGIFCNKSGARIVRNIIRDNVIITDKDIAEGGGIAAEADGIGKLLIIEDNIIKNNKTESTAFNAESGGLGIYTNCRISGNLVENNQTIGSGFAGAAALGAGQWNEMIINNNRFIGNESIMTSSSNFAYAVIILSQSKVDFFNNHLERNSTRGGRGTGGTVIFMHGVSRANISHNIFKDNVNKVNNFTSRLCFAQESANVLIAGNVMRDNNRVNGIYLLVSDGIVRDNEIVNNKGYYGVAIAGWESTMLIDNNIILNNQAQTSTGGIWMTKMTSALIQNNIISGNRANSAAAGGVAVWDGGNQNMLGTLLPERPDYAEYLTHRVPMFKSAQKTTAAIPDFKSVVLINNTITDNYASNYGGGVYIQNWETHLVNNIIWGNQAGQKGYEQIAYMVGRLTVQNCNVQGGWKQGQNIIDADPLFKGDTFELSDMSQCIGKGAALVTINGVDLNCPEKDCHDGVRPNPEGSNPDIGAYESPLAEPEGTGIEATLLEIPREFSLLQNYPNPFNPITTLSYTVPQPGRIKLSIYN
ncbi:hypothetical protein EH223_08930, partial [candidate division KSB1 bacterium]